jgi:hypothetical protein
MEIYPKNITANEKLPAHDDMRHAPKVFVIDMK